MSFNVPLNQVGSVRMEMAAAPPLAYFSACSAALMFGAIIPLLGDALNEEKRGRENTLDIRCLLKAEGATLTERSPV